MSTYAKIIVFVVVLLILYEVYLHFRRPIAHRLGRYLVGEAAFEDTVYRARWVFYLGIIILMLVYPLIMNLPLLVQALIVLGVSVLLFSFYIPLRVIIDGSFFPTRLVQANIVQVDIDFGDDRIISINEREKIQGIKGFLIRSAVSTAPCSSQARLSSSFQVRIHTNNEVFTCKGVVLQEYPKDLFLNVLRGRKSYWLRLSSFKLWLDEGYPSYTV